MSTKYCGYCGKVLKVNLTDRSVSEYPFSDKDREKYLGGKIMAAKIIADHIKGKIDPLSEENVIVVTTGPLNALGAALSLLTTQAYLTRFSPAGPMTNFSPLSGICSCASPVFIPQYGVASLNSTPPAVTLR